MVEPTYSRIALNALWIALPEFAYPFDDWVRDVYSKGDEWEQIAAEVKTRTVSPIAPNGWEPSRPTLSAWYPHLRRLSATEYAQPKQVAS